MKIDLEVKLDFDDVLILPKRSVLKSRKDVDITRTFVMKHSGRTWTGVPIIAANMDTIGTFAMHKALSKYHMMTAFHKFYTEEQHLTAWQSMSDREVELAWFSIGMREQDYQLFQAVQEKLDNRIQNLCIDVPSAYLESFVDFLSKVREENPDLTIMAGNVCTPEMTEALVLAGADIVKTGIGGGGQCSTRRVAGVGVPQLSAVIECADASHGLKGLLCSDGGIVYPGDLGKAFGGNADFIMMGSVLGGHKECDGELWERGKLYNPIRIVNDTIVNTRPNDPIPDVKMKIYGMASQEAMDKHYSGKSDYKAAEGRVSFVPYKGTVANTVEEFLGGLRSTMSYIGAEKLKEVSKRTTFIRTNRILNRPQAE